MDTKIVSTVIGLHVALAAGALFFSVTAQQAVAETMGVGSYKDQRIQTAIYSPDEVYRIQAAVGRTALIELRSDESVLDQSGLIITGDPLAWDLGVNKSGNRVSLKPGTNADPDTNLIVSTTRRSYVLELKLAKPSQALTYLLRWTYPEPPKKPALVRSSNQNPCSGAINRSYQKQGDMELSPYEVWDNGTFTCFRFISGGPQPVLYQVLPDGTETLANTRQVDNILVVHGVSKMFRFRLNDLVLAYRTRQPLIRAFNYNGTTTGETRVVKNAE